MEQLSLYEFAAKWEVEYRNRESDDEHAELDDALFLLQDAYDVQSADVVAIRPTAYLNREELGDNKHRNQRAPQSCNHQYS